LRVTAVEADGTRAAFLQPQSAALNFKTCLAHCVTYRDGTIEEHRPFESIQNWLAKAIRNPVAVRVLRLRNTDDLSWSDLYRLYEVIEHDVGGATAIERAGWSSGALLERFTRSANSLHAAGDQARHGVERTDPPRNPLTLSEARELIDKLLRAWLDQLP